MTRKIESQNIGTKITCGWVQSGPQTRGGPRRGANAAILVPVLMLSFGSQFSTRIPQLDVDPQEKPKLACFLLSTLKQTHFPR